ncbi:MAG: peptidylprolyl isomerase, partial [Acidobacteria bacterium]|nr:peptidylprolyl isomerase [Candidatus Polarisedimenticola svalbardensis]
TDPDPGVRAETVQAMGTLGRQELLTAALVEDGSFHVRANLAQVLSTAKGRASLEILRKLEEDGSTSVKAATIRSVSARLGIGYRMLLEEHLKDARWPVRAAAAAAGGFPSAVSDDDPRVAAAALAGMEDKLADPDVAAAVRSALTSNDLAVRGSAAGLLEEWPYPDKVDLLKQVLAASTGVRWIELQAQVRDALNELREQAPEEEPLPQEAELPSRTFKTNPVVVMETSKGVMEIECFPADAPVHVANFVKLVEEGTYDGLIWHRVVPNFVIQGGDPEGNGWGGPGYTIPDEINRQRYGRGAVGMPKLGKDTGGCQLFVTHIPTPHLDGNYTIFGQVISGMEVIDRIEVGDVILKATLK